MAQMQEMIFMKMTNGEYIYGTNLDIVIYMVGHDWDGCFQFHIFQQFKVYGNVGSNKG